MAGASSPADKLVPDGTRMPNQKRSISLPDISVPPYPSPFHRDNNGREIHFIRSFGPIDIFFVHYSFCPILVFQLYYSGQICSDWKFSPKQFWLDPLRVEALNLPRFSTFLRLITFTVFVPISFKFGSCFKHKYSSYTNIKILAINTMLATNRSQFWPRDVAASIAKDSMTFIDLSFTHITLYYGWYG